MVNAPTARGRRWKGFVSLLLQPDPAALAGILREFSWEFSWELSWEFSWEFIHPCSPAPLWLLEGGVTCGCSGPCPCVWLSSDSLELSRAWGLAWKCSTALGTCGWLGNWGLTSPACSVYGFSPLLWLSVLTGGRAALWNLLQIR